VLASVEELAYKALLPPHPRGGSRAGGYMCWGFSGVFGSFMRLRFIWCLCAIPIEVDVNETRKSNKGFTVLVF